MKKILFILLVAVFMFTSCPHKSVTINNYTTTTTGSGDTTPSEPKPEPEVLIPSVEKVLYFKQKLSDNSIAERVYIFGENLKVLSEDDVYANDGGMLENFKTANLKGKIIIYFDYSDGPLVSERGKTDTIVVKKESLNVYNEFTIKFNNFIVNVGDSVVLTGIDGELPTEVVIPEGVEAIADDLFTGNTDIVSVDMSDSEITHIGASAFYGCSNIETVTFPNSLTKIDISCFEDCSSLKVLDFSNTQLVTIKGQGLSFCSLLETVYFPSTLKYIHNYAFGGCNNLKKVYFADKNNWYYTPTENIENVADIPCPKDETKCIDITEDQLSETNAATNLITEGWKYSYVIKRDAVTE